MIDTGRKRTALVYWRNSGPIPYAPVLSLHIKNSDWGSNWQAGPDYPSTPISPNGMGALDLRSIPIPDEWDDKRLFAQVRADGRVLAEDSTERVFRNRFTWPAESTGFQWDNPERTQIYASNSPQHRGVGIRVWVGWGVFPVVFDGISQYHPAYDPQGMNFGPDVWKGTYLDWADNDTWQSWSAQLQWQHPLPGYGDNVSVAALWVVQRESPADRRMRGEAPLTYEFGAESVKWGLSGDRVLEKGEGEVLYAPGFYL